ncbi:hypothetical protein ACQKGC_23820 [Allorhizobium pseudoryzae]|uniref:hypothetical protein n=1 Tax=Allorhizobium pseudoryzae TaxID=379684 RepID=UPI003D08B972
MSDAFHRNLRKRFGDRVPFAPEYIEIPCQIEGIVTEFFEGLAALDPSVRVQRIWLDGGKLCIVTNGSHTGLDDIIADAEAAAEHLRVREGLQPIIDDLFQDLADYAHAVHIYGIIDRGEGLVVIDARVSDDITAADKYTVYRILEEYQERLNEF